MGTMMYKRHLNQINLLMRQSTLEAAHLITADLDRLARIIWKYPLSYSHLKALFKCAKNP